MTPLKAETKKTAARASKKGQVGVKPNIFVRHYSRLSFLSAALLKRFSANFLRVLLYKFSGKPHNVFDVVFTAANLPFYLPLSSKGVSTVEHRLRKEMKRGARDALRGHLGQSVCILLLLFAILLAVSVLEWAVLAFFSLPFSPYLDDLGTPGVFLDDVYHLSLPVMAVTAGACLLRFILLVPLFAGMLRWFAALSAGSGTVQPLSLSMVFHFFISIRRWGKSLLLAARLAFRSLAWGILFFLLPGAVVGLTSWLFRQQPDSLLLYYQYFAVLLTAFLLAMTVLLWSLFLLRYLPALLLLAVEDLLPLPLERQNVQQPAKSSLSTGQILRMSVSLMKGKRIQAAGLLLSFLPWLFLSAAVLPILWLFPYFLMTTTLYLRYLLFQREKKQSIQLANRTCEYPPPGGAQEKMPPSLTLSSDPTIDLS